MAFRTHTVHGWCCNDCHIIAGFHELTFATFDDAQAEYERHVADRHENEPPEGSWAVSTQRGFAPRLRYRWHDLRDFCRIRILHFDA